MKKLLTALFVAASFTPAAALADQSLLANHSDPLVCGRAVTFRPYHDGYWNTKHRFALFNAGWRSSSRLYTFSKGQVIVVWRDPAFVYNSQIKEKWVFIGNRNQGTLCPVTNWNTGEQYVPTFTETYIPGTNCTAILINKENQAKPSLFGVLNTSQCEKYHFAGYFEGPQKAWLANNIHGYSHLLK